MIRSNDIDFPSAALWCKACAQFKRLCHFVKLESVLSSHRQFVTACALHFLPSISGPLGLERSEKLPNEN